MSGRLLAPLAAAVLVLADLADVLTTDDWRGPVAAALVAAVLIPAPLALAARRPLLAGLGTTLALLVTAVALGSPQSLVPLLCLLLAGFVIGFDRGRIRWIGAAAVLGTAVVAIARARTGGLPPSIIAFVFALLLYTAPVVLGAVVRARTDAARTARELADRAEREQRLAALLAVRDERGRIARDLHEVVTAAVDRIVADAGEGLAAVRSDAAAANAAFDSIERTGQHALEDMRRLLGVLRTVAAAPSRAPQPRLADLELLLSAAASQGVRPSVRIVGRSRPLPEPVELCAYRLIEAALEEAAVRPGEAEVQVHYDDSALHLTVRTTPGGFGPLRLRPMQERAALCGGSLLLERDDAHDVIAASLPVPA